MTIEQKRKALRRKYEEGWLSFQEYHNLLAATYDKNLD